MTWAHQTGHAASEWHPSTRTPTLLHNSGQVPRGLQDASQSSPKQTPVHQGFEHSPGSRSIRDIIFPESQQSALSSDQSETGDAEDGKAEDDVFSSNAALSVADDSRPEDKRSPTKPNKVIFDPNSPSPLSVRYPLRPRSPNWTEHDFPPLGPMIGGQKMSGGCWSDRKQQAKPSDPHGGYVFSFSVLFKLTWHFNQIAPNHFNIAACDTTCVECRDASSEGDFGAESDRL